MINVTTSYNNPDMDQFMFAIKASTFNDALNFRGSDFQLYVSHVAQTFDKTTQKYSLKKKDYFL